METLSIGISDAARAAGKAPCPALRAGASARAYLQLCAAARERSGQSATNPAARLAGAAVSWLKCRTAATAQGPPR
ncbi:hypothetical protein [Novosphingobium sp.]|uniref:hypothetical protein n=1 Tax=Novosphingobium sp. TaxID=1874826 RepID=UPI001DEDD59D|nr:hypothetical protein [Novosphingobium sp.]MBX9662199.1 hypothetical protein [Novosphingobium sp.]